MHLHTISVFSVLSSTLLWWSTTAFPTTPDPRSEATIHIPNPNIKPNLTLLIESPYTINDTTSSLDVRAAAAQTTRNDLNGPCKPVTVIFARGTIEVGNVGLIAGPPFFDALADRIGSDNLAVQGVDYAATIPGYLEGGDPAGATTMVKLVEEAAYKCPSTEIVLSGYSQGAQLVHLATPQLDPATATHINAVVLFGDPDNGDILPNIEPLRTQSFCFPGDLICDGGLPLVLPFHLLYSVDAPDAADYVVTRLTE